MARKIKARFSQGKIEPLENVPLQEGQEIVISIEDSVPHRRTTNRGKEFTLDDSLWNLVGIGEGHDATHVSQNKHKYLADAYGCIT